MKILFILDEFLPENGAGATNIAFSLAKGLIKSGHNLLVLTATNSPGAVGEIEIEDVKIKRILTKPFGRFRNFKNLKNKDILIEAEKILAEYKPDVTHIHTLHHRFSYGIIGLAKKFSKAVFLTLHDAQTIFNGKLYPKKKNCGLDSKCDYKKNWFDRLKKDRLTYNPFQSFFIKRALKKADKIFAVSKALKEAVETNGIFGIEVVHNGINADEWIMATGEISGGNNVLFAGRVDEAKGVGILIKAFNIVRSEIPNAKLTIVGDGNFNTGGGQNIEVVSWQGREVMKNFFSAAKIIAVPSLYLDPFPTVNLEAMAAGKPVIGTCFGGTPEIVVNNKTGYILDPYNERELVEKIIDLLKNPKKAARFGENGRVRVKNLFSLERQINETLKQYNKFIQK